MKPEIVCIEKLFDESTCTGFYRVVVNYSEMPKLKLGNCEEIKQ